jgi:hypothetical protein
LTERSWSPVAAIRGLLRHQAAYAAHGDPATFAANKIALLLAWNSPLYPVYVLILVGHDALPYGLLSVLVTPFFYAIPWISRRSAAGARVALALVGAANTIWCLKLFGPASGVGLFLYPCIILPTLLFRLAERWVTLPLLGLMLVLWFLPAAALGTPLVVLTVPELARLSALNAGSVAFLLSFMVLQLVDVMRAIAKGGATL